MIEAMACGTPVIAYNRGSVPEVVEHGVTGFIVEDEVSAAGAVRDLANLSRDAIRARFEDRFTSRRMAAQYVDVYRNLNNPGLPYTPLVHPPLPRPEALDRKNDA